MTRSVKVVCPYCGHVNELRLTDNKDAPGYPLFHKSIVSCDNETGGCDKDFMIEAEVHVTVTTGTIERTGKFYRS